MEQDTTEIGLSSGGPGDHREPQPGDKPPAPAARPDVSVVIASVNGLPYPLRCLEALDRQDGDQNVEVIVADCTGPETVAAITERFPAVRVLSYDERKSVPWLRAAGIRTAHGRLVAVTEDHCVPRPDWINVMVEAAQRTGWSAIGGGVENGSVEHLIDWAVYFCEYHALMSPVPAGPATAIPGMNVVYDMDRLTDLRNVFGEGLWENFLHDHIRAGGHEIGLEPSMVVDHCKRFTIQMFVAERFAYSRAFAGRRVEGQTLGQRMTWAAKSFLVAPLVMARITRVVFQRRRHLGWYIRSLPLVALFSVVGAAGEFVGYLAGPGDSLVRIR